MEAVGLAGVAVDSVTVEGSAVVMRSLTATPPPTTPALPLSLCGGPCALSLSIFNLCLVGP